MSVDYLLKEGQLWNELLAFEKDKHFPESKLLLFAANSTSNCEQVDKNEGGEVLHDYAIFIYSK